MDTFYNNKRVLVTGGAGFIGSFLVLGLLRAGARVTVITRPGGNTWRIVDMSESVAIMSVDLLNKEETLVALTSIKPELIFNLASLVNTKQSIDVLDELLLQNFTIAKNLFQAAVVASVEKVVQVGSIEEYGHGEVPFVETAREAPISPYSLAKVMTTHLALGFHRLGALRVSVVRPAATFGPAQGFGMLTPNLIRACLEKQDFRMNPGDQIRDLIFVDDVVRGMMAAGARPEADGEIINLGSNKLYRIREVVLRINELLGNPITIHFGAYPYRPLDTMRFYMDSHKAHQLLDWHARTDLALGMQQTVAWYRAHYQEMPYEKS